MKCSFCSSKKVKDDQMPFCDNCWNALEKSEVPPIEFKEFFLEGLEGKLKDVDSFLFNLPDNFFLWYMKGHLEHELGSTKKALNSIKTSISYKEDYGDSWIRLGLIYSDMHKENDAIENFKKGLRFTLRDPSNLVDAGISLQASDHSKLASMILQRALDLVPDDDRAIVGLGKVYSQIGQLDDAKNILERGLELYPHNEEVLRAMAQIILRMEDMDSAMEIYSRILDQHPRDFEALLAKAEIHLRKRELNSSIKTYQAVRDLDIHISWSGIMKFLISSIRSIFEDNQNSLSYRDDLKKEFENILLYLKDLDQRSSSSTGSEIMDNIEKLVKIVESLKLSLKDQLEQFEELLDKYKVENSFHHHLEGKVKNLKDFISDGRYFDAKQITLELSPFLMDLRKMNTRDEAKVKKNLRSKLRELKEFGMENKDLSIRLDEIEKLEEEGNSEGATFMLKEIELSLEEYYIECSTDLHEIKIKEMETLLKEAKNRFDTSGLKEKLEKFGNFQGWGPKEIGQKYMDFIKQYEKGSSTYYLDETRKMLKEIDYKLVILEKDEMKVKGPRERHRDLQSEAEDRSAPGVVFQKVTNFMKEIQEIEENHKVSAIRERLRELDTLLGEVDLLGMDNALAKNVEPVRGVIERSLKQNNFRLSEILTNEVYENVEKLLREKYLKKIKEILTEMEGEIFRFKGLGIHRKDWSISIERSNSIILKKAQGEITEVISHMARVQSEVQKFYIDELPDEIDRKISDSEQLLEEGEGLGLKLDDLKNKITRMASSAEDISTLDLLEDTYKLETDLEKEIRGQLSENVRTFANEIRKKAERIDGLSLTKRDVLKLISSSNRAEVILENGQERDAYRMIIDTMEQMDRIWEEVLNELKERRLAEIDELMNISNKLNIGISDFEEDRSVLVMEKEPDPYSNLELAEAIHAGLLERVQESSRDIYRGLKADFKELLDRISNMIPDEMSLEIRELMRDLKECVKQERFNKMPDMVSQSYDIMKTAKEKAKETYYLENCSEILEIVFSIENDEAKALITDSQDLAKRIGKGEIKGVEDEIKEMGKKARALRDLQDIQDLESMLQNIRDMDNLANDISSNIDEQNGLYESVQKIISVIGTMIDRLSKLHNNPGREMVEDMKVQITTTREDLVEIENLWRAGRRLESLKEAGLSEGNIGGPLLLDDIGNLNNQYKNREWTKFFRTWERIETQMKKMERRGELKGFNMEWFRSMTKGSDKGMEVLSRKQMQIPKDKMGYRPRSRKGGGGIQKLAQDMGEKRKKLEKAPMVKSDKKENEKDPREVDQKELEGRTKGEDELMGIARLIAGKRIKELKKDRSKALEEEGGSEMLWKNDRSDRISPADPVKDLEDYMDLDTSLRRSDISEDISKVRDKLILFFDKLPELSQLDDASEHFERGEEALRKEENNKALGEYRLSISQAIKVGRVHADIGKALGTVKNTISTLRESGLMREGVEELHREAEELYKKGDLLGCAKKIKFIKTELTRE